MFPALLGAWLGSAVLSTAFSPHPFQSFIRSTWSPWLLAGLLLVHVLNNRIPVRTWLPWITTGFTVVLLLGSLWQWHTGWHLEAGRLWRVHGLLPHPNDTAMLSVVLPLASWWAWPLGLVVVFLSGSRTAVVGLGVAACLLVRSWRWRVAIVAAIGLSLVLVTHAAALTSVTGRVGAWMVAARMFRLAPVFGLGPNTFVDHYLADLPKVTPLPFGAEPVVAFIPWAHNLYLEQLAERGVIGFAVFSVAAAWAWRWGSGPQRAALTAFLAMGLMDLTFLKPWVVGAFWGLVMLSDQPGHGIFGPPGDRTWPDRHV